MKILSKGNVYTADVWRCKCKFCSTRVEILAGDPAVHPEAVEVSNCVAIKLDWRCPVCDELNESTGISGIDDAEYCNNKKLNAETAKEILKYRTTFNKSLHSQNGETIGYEIGFYKETDWFKAYEEYHKLLNRDEW